MEIPNQYTMGFTKHPNRVIPPKERAYGKHIGETIILNGGADCLGVFEGTYKTQEGLAFCFSARGIYRAGRCDVKEGFSEIITTAQPIVKTVPEGIYAFAENHNVAVEKDKEPHSK